MSLEKTPAETCVLVTGGAGFIGSHTVVELLEGGYQVVIVDDLSNASEKVLDRIAQIVGDEAAERMSFIRADVADRDALEAVFESFPIDRVIHFAGFKAVGESVAKPIEYYGNNIGNTIALIDTMRAYGCKDIIFSSSATVYGEHNKVPFREDMAAGGTTNPYGTTKYFIEIILKDLCAADPEWSVSLLRYFNPIGAHESGKIGEAPNGIPNNLMPYIAQVAVGKREKLSVFGNDYDTPDGTGVRDYIHVVDLAKGHLAAVKRAEAVKGCEIYNLGTGVGVSVLELVHAFEKATGVKIPYVIAPRRPGDIAYSYADASKAWEVLGWKTEKTAEDACRDTWRWQKNNPNGYDD